MYSSINVLLVDDHYILREGLKTLIESEPEMRVTASAGTAQEGLARALESHLQVAIIDYSLPDHDGLWLLQQLRIKKPNLPVIVLSMCTDRDTIMKVLSEGASGYLTKSADSVELLAAIRAAILGESYVQPAIASLLVGALRKHENVPTALELGERERQILQRVAEGCSNQEIASELFISISTVKAHLRSLFQKLDVSSRTEVVVEALRRGLIVSDAPE